MSLLLEVGLGGRLDATNTIEKPLASVITPVSMDHTEFLGTTLTSIAGEKAAIIKRGVPVISAEQAPEAMAVIEAQARRMRAPLHAAGQQWHVSIERGRLVYQDDRGLMDLAAPKLFGRHQFDNAGLAIATLRAIDAFKISHAAFEAGIVHAEWPARMQRLASGKLVDQAPAGSEVWLDGGHNAEGGRVAAAALGDLEERVSRPLVIIAGMMGNKDANGFLANFAGQTRHIMVVPIPDQDNVDAAGPAGGCRARARHARGDRRERRGRAAHAVGPCLRCAAAHPDHRLALSRRPRAFRATARRRIRLSCPGRGARSSRCARQDREAPWRIAATGLEEQCALLRLPMCTETISRWKP